METITAGPYSLVIEYGDGVASFPALRSRKGVYDPCVSQT
jgi:hypothetical protein